MTFSILKFSFLEKYLCIVYIISMLVENREFHLVLCSWKKTRRPVFLKTKIKWLAGTN